MSKFFSKKTFFYITIFLFIFFLDRITKISIINILDKSEYNSIYINNFINFVLIWNSGVGFGLFSSENYYIYNTTTLLITLINLLILFLIYKSNNIKRLIFVVILGGSSGNLFDRFYYSAVPDFIDINYNEYHWFIFNVADIFISIGIFCLIFVEVFDYKKKQ